MDRAEALRICGEELMKHEGGMRAYYDILDDLQRLNEYEDDEEDEEEEENE